jgi:hypothetical protein
MKFLQSIWRPASSEVNDDWANLRECDDCWRLSNKLLNQHGDVEFWGCELGVAYAKKIGLRFNKMHYFPDEELKGVNSRVWSAGKLYAASRQEEPFLHVDGDVFLYKWQKGNLPPFLCSHSEFFYEGRAGAWAYGTLALLFASKRGGELRDVLWEFFSAHRPGLWNFGIFGGTSLELPKACGKIFELARQVPSGAPPDVFLAAALEQIFVPVLMEIAGIKTTVYLNDVSEATEKGFCHLIGKTKEYPEYVGKVRERLATLG